MAQKQQGAPLCRQFQKQDQFDDDIQVFKQKNDQPDLKNNRTGHWNQKQNAKYFAFLEKFKDKFSVRQSRRQWKIFKALSEFVKTRDPSQCRSHHHKMTKNFKSIQQTLQSMKNRNSLLQQRSKKYAQKLEKIDISTMQQGAFFEAFRQNNLQHQKKLLQNNQQQRFASGLEKNFFTKQQDNANCKTQPGYQKNEKTQQNQEVKQSGKQWSRFPTTGLLSKQYVHNQQRRVGQNLQVNIGSNSYGASQYLNPPSTIFQNNYQHFHPRSSMQFHRFPDPNLQLQQRWIDCHNTFLRWVNKINSLIV